MMDSMGWPYYSFDCLSYRLLDMWPRYGSVTVCNSSAVHSIALCSVQNTVTAYSVQYTVYSIQSTVHSIQCKEYSKQCTVSGEQCPVHNAQWPPSGAQCPGDSIAWCPPVPPEAEWQ